MPTERKLAAIMFTDIVGYTALMSLDEQKALELLKTNRELLKPLIKEFRGEWLKEMGDGSLSSFSSAIDAVGCAIALQDILRRNEELKIRIGIHLGDIVFEQEDVFGDGVNIASRIEPLAKPGGVCISEQIYQTIRNKPGIEATFGGEHTLKGIEQPVKIYHITRARAGSRKAVPVQSPSFGPGWPKWVAAGILGVILVWAGSSLLFTSRPAEARLGPKSVAVLPFTSLSADTEDEYFSDGITDVILTNLSKIKDLKVISRTSTMQYKGSDKTIIQIARELGVATILDGSVQRAGGRIRIVSQLIDARTDEHLWAETYDRNVTDIFAIQTEIAEHIAAALKAKLLPKEIDLLSQPLTENVRAYEAYLKGISLLADGTSISGAQRTIIDEAIGAFQGAIDIDPLFAAAYARLSYAFTTIHFYLAAPPLMKEKAKEALDRTLELNPDLPAGQVALGYYENLVNRNYEAALSAFAKAQAALPNNSDIMTEVATVHMRLGNWNEALENFEKAVEVNPRSATAQDRLATAYLYLRQYPEAEKTFEIQTALAPSNPSVYTNRIQLSLLADGDMEKAKKILHEGAKYTSTSNIMTTGVELIQYLGFWRFGLLDERVDDTINGFLSDNPTNTDLRYYFSLAQLHEMAHQPARASAYFGSAVTVTRDMVTGAPGVFTVHSLHGLALVKVGEKEFAIEAGLQAMALMPISECHW